MTHLETIHVHTVKRSAWVTLDRPPLNVLDIPTMRSLSRHLDHPVRTSDFIVFQGAGPKGFSAGAEIRDHTPDRVAEMLAAFHGIFRQLARSDCVTIAAVHGICLHTLLMELSAHSSAILRLTRHAWRRGLAGEGAEGFEQELAAVERLYLEELMRTEDARESVRAFLEKRDPVWHGR